MKFSLRFPAGQIPAWAATYSYPSDADIETAIAPAVKEQRFLTKGQFLKLTKWKSPRSQPRCEQNDAEYVEEVTGKALQSKNDRFKIGSLRLLDGVEWPTASVILHFCDEERYPILDYRALWSLGLTRTIPYDYGLWADYTTFTRDLAVKARVTMRTLDRALWRYSKERQRL